MSIALTDAVHVHDTARRDFSRYRAAVGAYLLHPCARNRAALLELDLSLASRWTPSRLPLAEVDEIAGAHRDPPQFGRGELE